MKVFDHKSNEFYCKNCHVYHYHISTRYEISKRNEHLLLHVICFIMLISTAQLDTILLLRCNIFNMFVIFVILHCHCEM